MPSTTSVEANKALVRKTIDEVWNQGNWAATEDSYAEDLIVHFAPMPDPLHGRDGFRELHDIVRRAFPDYHVTIDDILGDGDRVAARWTMRATHRGEFLGIRPTGREIAVTEFALFTFRDGKAQEIRLMPDMMGQLQQLGVMPKGPPPKAIIVVMRLVGRIQELLGRRK